jgi:PAS domain S-box-containing protein
MVAGWHSFFVHRTRGIVVAVSVLLLALILLLGWSSYREVKDVVTEDFNSQQLLLARYAARQIGNLIEMLKKEIKLLSLSPSLQYSETVAVASRMGITFSSVREEGAVEIRYLRADGRPMRVIDAAGTREAPTAFEDRPLLTWARDPAQQGRVLMSEVSGEAGGGGTTRLVMKMATPVWQVSPDESHPRPPGTFSGVLVFVVDVTQLVAKPARDVRSGKSGYAWVIDNRGTFLYHPEKSFVGEDAFEARRRKMPTISFDRINQIQKTMLMSGREGKSWYVTGWHLGKEGVMRKLIAYSPIRLQEGPGGPVWSVAVVAPTSEVEGAIRDVQVRGLALQAVIVVAFLLGTVVIVTLMARWSASLEEEVARQTRELKRSEQRYRSLVESAGDGIYTVNRAGTVLSANSSAARFFGRPAEQVVGANLAELFACPTAEEPLLAIDEVFETKRGRQITHLAKVGEREYWLSSSFRRLIDETGAIYAVLGISRDITDRKAMEEQSYNTEKLASLGTLAAGVAHEINNPLAVILGFTELLLEKAAPGSEQEDVLKTVQSYGNKAKKVVENLLTFARRKEHSEGEVDINECLRAVFAVLGNNLLVHKIAVERFDLDPGLPPVKGDADELQQVFFNIITNALYAMRKGGSLAVATRTRENGSCVEIAIGDTGPGIPREHRSRIFDPLFTTKKVGEGTGLGLSVSYGIITRHRGTIGFETLTSAEAAATGTTFTITLPASGPRREARAEGPAPQAQGGGGGGEQRGQGAREAAAAGDAAGA